MKKLTSSNFGFVINCKIILDSKIPETARAIKWGGEHESAAYAYAELSSHHQKSTLWKSGFYIGEPLFLGISPDGVLADEFSTVQGIIEINSSIQQQN